MVKSKPNKFVTDNQPPKLVILMESLTQSRVKKAVKLIGEKSYIQKQD